MRSSLPLLLVLSIALTAFAGCSTKTNPPSSPAMTASVEMKGIQFSPKEVTIAKGGTVTWTNKEAIGHDVHSDDGTLASGDTGGIAKDATYSKTFDTAGTFEYYCKAHGKGMSGKVIVK